MRKKGFGDYSLPGKVMLLLIAGVSLVVIATAERDIQRRGADEVRGSRVMWRVVSLNALGALAYLRFGRRRAA